MKASKHVIQSGDESDSDESDHDSEVQSEPEANEDIQPAQPTSQEQRKCNYCHAMKFLRNGKYFNGAPNLLTVC